MCAIVRSHSKASQMKLLITQPTPTRDWDGMGHSLFSKITMKQKKVILHLYQNELKMIFFL